MERNEFDQILRDRLDGVTEAAPDVWEGIEKGLVRRHRRVLLRRFTVAAASAAAGLALALTVLPGLDQRGSALPVRTAHLLWSQPDTVGTGQEPEVAPIRQQIAAFTKNQAMARAENVVSPEVVPEEVLPGETLPDNTQPETTQPEVTSVKEQQPEEAGDHRLSEDEIPSSFWTTEDEPSSRTHKTHTSLSILSNLTTVGSDGDLIYKASPMHSSSQTGNRASSIVEPYSESPKFFSPLSLGLQVELPLAGRLSLSTGLSYSYLVSQYDMLIDKVLYENAFNQLHYVGIPLTLSYRFVETPSFGFYGSFGGAVEKCVSQRYVYGSNILHEKVGGVQWSARVGIGAEYWFIPRMGIYFDPSLVYFFDNSQPLSIRTQQPLQTRFEIGLRFKI